MEHWTTRVNDDTDRRLNQLCEDRDLSRSEALKIAANEGLPHLGYGAAGINPDTRLRAALRETARVFGYGGGSMLATATLLPLLTQTPLPLDVRLVGVVLAAVGVLAYATEHVLEASGSRPVESLVNQRHNSDDDREAVTDGGGD